MKICFCSLLLPPEKKLVERTKEKIQIPGHKLAMSMIEGIEQNTCDLMTVINIINVVNYPSFPQILFKTEAWSHAVGAQDWHVGYINLVGIKYITQSFNQYNKLRRFIRSNRDEKVVILVENLFWPSLLAANRAKRRYKNVVTCLSTGDLSGRFGLSACVPGIKGYLLDWGAKIFG